MYWRDLYCDKILSKKQVTDTLCKVFRITEEGIFLVDNIENIKQKDNEIRLLCQSSIVKSNFPLKLAIFLDDCLVPSNDLLVVGRFCAINECRALIGSDSIDPYDWIMVINEVEHELIGIDLDEYDNPEPVLLE